jgi:hypothetical protein
LDARARTEGGSHPNGGNVPSRSIRNEMLTSGSLPSVQASVARKKYQLQLGLTIE